MASCVGFGPRLLVSSNQPLNHSTWRLCKVIELGVLGGLEKSWEVWALGPGSLGGAGGGA